MLGKLAGTYVEIGADTKPFDLSLTGLRTKLNRLAMTRFTLPGGGFLGLLGGAALVMGINHAIKGASDLNETISKVGAVFGAQSKDVTKAADEMAESFGIPKREFLDAASQFGLIAVGMGQTQDEAGKMSIKFAKLAADAASFYNVPVDEALEKIRAGLTGESEPLKAFGVIMDETTMKVEAARMGLVKKGQELTNQEKLITRMALIEKGLATATGDLARTQDGASNQSRKFWGMLQNLGDTIGATLLPAVNKFLSLINAVGTDMYASAQKGSGAWSDFITTVGQGIDFLGLLYRNWGDIVELTSLRIASGFQGVIDQIGHIANVTQSFLQWFGLNWPKIISDAVKASAASVKNFSELFTNPQAFAAKVITGEISKPGSGLANALGAGIKIDTPAFKAPEFAQSTAGKLFEVLIGQVTDRMNKREQEQAAKNFKAGPGGALANGGAAPGDVPGGAKSQKTGVIDFEAYNRELQDAALQKDDTQKKMLDVQQKQLAELQAIKSGIAKPRMGLGAAAVFG